MLVQARVDFKRPKKTVTINKNYTFVDMHLHSLYSDGTRRIPTIAKKAKKLGIGISITDHNEIKGSIEIGKYKDILSIPGIETTSKEGIHSLFYFYNEEDLAEFYNHNVMPYKNKKTFFLDIPFLELLDISRDYNCIKTIAHPYAPSWAGMCNSVHEKIVTPKIVKAFDAVEVLNSQVIKFMNQNAIYLAENLKIGITGGSDGHRLFELGKALTYTKFQANREEFLKSILNKENFVIGKQSTIPEKAFAHHLKIAEPVINPLGTMSRSYRFIKNKI